MHRRANSAPVARRELNQQPDDIEQAVRPSQHQCPAKDGMQFLEELRGFLLGRLAHGMIHQEAIAQVHSSLCEYTVKFALTSFQRHGPHAVELILARRIQRCHHLTS